MAAESTHPDPSAADPASDEPEVPCDRLRPLTTGDLARACDTTVRTVRFYEEAGVLCPETRTEGGHRLFGKDNLAKLQLIMDLREAGLSLNDIRALFELKKEHPSPEGASQAMQEVLEGQIEEMQRKIACLRRLREELAQTVAIIQECQGCESKSFPESCFDCDVMERSDLPRAMRLLWGRDCK
ncbi:MAG: MerR family transcriptional regulator [Myxococcota bacterium]|nr:MerR family transcriptional regulator [Myxococcota bacterium]